MPRLPCQNTQLFKLTSGEPDTLRGVRPVRRGAFGNLLQQCDKALGAYPTPEYDSRIEKEELMKVFTAYFTKEDGTRVYARNHGKRCFVFEADGRTRKSRARAASKAKRSGKTK